MEALLKTQEHVKALAGLPPNVAALKQNRDSR